MWHVLLSAFLTMLVLVALHWLVDRSRPMHSDAMTGSIRPSLVATGIVLLGGASISALALWASVYAQGGWGALVVGLAFAVTVVLGLPTCLPTSIITWDEDGLEGPAHALWPPFVRNKIAWPDIAEAGDSAGGYHFIQAFDGRRIYWHDFYSGVSALYEAMIKRRPLPPEDEEQED